MYICTYIWICEAYKVANFYVSFSNMLRVNQISYLSLLFLQTHTFLLIIAISYSYKL